LKGGKERVDKTNRGGEQGKMGLENVGGASPGGNRLGGGIRRSGRILRGKWGKLGGVQIMNVRGGQRRENFSSLQKNGQEKWKKSLTRVFSEGEGGKKKEKQGLCLQDKAVGKREVGVVPGEKAGAERGCLGMKRAERKGNGWPNERRGNQASTCRQIDTPEIVSLDRESSRNR